MDFTVELGQRMFLAVMILGLIFLSERWIHFFKSIKLSHTDFISHELERKNKIVEGVKL